jgi:hypothetical protein
MSRKAPVQAAGYRRAGKAALRWLHHAWHMTRQEARTQSRCMYGAWGPRYSCPPHLEPPVKPLLGLQVAQGSGSGVWVHIDGQLQVRGTGQLKQHVAQVVLYVRYASACPEVIPQQHLIPYRLLPLLLMRQTHIEVVLLGDGCADALGCCEGGVAVPQPVHEGSP